MSMNCAREGWSSLSSPDGNITGGPSRGFVEKIGDALGRRRRVGNECRSTNRTMGISPAEGSGKNTLKGGGVPQEKAGTAAASPTVSHARRCGSVLLEPREIADFDIESLIRGGSGLRMSVRWMALAPHLDEEVEIDAVEREILGTLGSVEWQPVPDLHQRFGAAAVDHLLVLGLLISDDESGSDFRERDDRLRATHWHALSAASHRFGRWRDVDSSDALEQSGMRSLRDLEEKLGPPPPHLLERSAPDVRIALKRPAPSPLSALMQQRTTCRNFDSARLLPADLFAAALERVFAAQAVQAISDGTAVLKKNSPSGGGLHATECYLLVQHVAGIRPGLYHYHAGEHALEPIADAGDLDRDALAALAARLVAGQTWFANAHAMAILTPRFARSYWKYRNHAKAYRALILDSGHLSQNLYLVATELGLGAYVTSAINEVEIERSFGLDGLLEGPLAVCGFGWRAATRETGEFDPLGHVWGRDRSGNSP